MYPFYSRQSTSTHNKYNDQFVVIKKINLPQNYNLGVKDANFEIIDQHINATMSYVMLGKKIVNLVPLAFNIMNVLDSNFWFNSIKNYCAYDS
jgi:hypothetical protein